MPVSGIKLLSQRSSKEVLSGFLGDFMRSKRLGCRFAAAGWAVECACGLVERQYAHAGIAANWAVLLHTPVCIRSSKTGMSPAVTPQSGVFSSLKYPRQHGLSRNVPGAGGAA